MSLTQGARQPEWTTLSPAEQVVSARHGDDTVLLNAATGRYYTLNQTGSRIWEWLCEGVSADAIVDRLHEMFGVTVEMARADVDALIQECLAAALVHAT
jgi:hypothetical protein